MKLALSILTCLVLTATTSAESIIRLRSSSAVQGPTVRLTDVATVQGVPEAAEQVVVLTLGEPGSGQWLSAGQVQDALSRAGVDVSAVQFTGAARCSVCWSRPQVTAVAAAPAAVQAEQTEPALQPAVQTTANEPAPASGAKTLAQQVTEQLVQQLNVPAGQIGLEFDAPCRDLAQSMPKGDVTISCSDRNELGHRQWRVDILVGARKYRHYLGGMVSVQREMVVAVRDIPAGAAVKSEDVRFETRPDSGRGGCMTSMPMVVGQQARKLISAGQPVTARDLVAAVLVKAGQPTDLVYRHGNLTVKTAGKALGDGRSGDRVQFELSGGKRIAAVVTAPGEAQVAAGSEAKS